MGNGTWINVIQVLMPLIAAGLEASMPRGVSSTASALPGKLLPPADALQGSLKEEVFKVSYGCFGHQKPHVVRKTTGRGCWTLCEVLGGTWMNPQAKGKSFALSMGLHELQGLSCDPSWRV